MINDITVIILTYNEEKNIKYALENVNGWAKQIIVLDSYSTDSTIDICSNYDVDIYYNKFKNFSSQRKHSLTHTDIKSEWIFILDADEYLTDELKKEISELLSSDKNKSDGYYINRRFYWKGKWLKRGFYPTTLLRFGRKGQLDCDNRPINEHLICKSGNTSILNHDFIDHNRKDLDDWVIKHNSYATREAEQLLVKDDSHYRLFKNQYERKRWIRKNIWNNLPPIVRPFIYFIYRYFIQLGFLDGKQGFMYHFIDSFVYRVLIDFKYLEKKWSSNEKN